MFVGLLYLLPPDHQANRANEVAERSTWLNLLLDFDRVLGLGLAEAISTGAEGLPADVADLIQQREAARTARDWATADGLRETIHQQGYQIEDTPSGTKWQRRKQQ